MKITHHLSNLTKGILVLGLLVAAPLSAAADFPYFHRPKNAADIQPRPDRATSRSDTDMFMIEQVNNAVGPYEYVNVDAEKGIITLTGKVYSMAERDDAINRARQVPGVDRVNSLLIIEQRPERCTY